MKPIVYIDVLFFINLFLNFLILQIGQRLIKIEIHSLRIWLGAILGAVYAVLMFFPTLSLLYSGFFKLLFSVLLVAIAYKPNGKKQWIRSLLLFYTVNFTFAGVMFGIFFFTNMGIYMGAMVSNGVFYFNFPLKLLITSSIVAYLIIHIGMRIIKSRQNKQFSNIFIEYKEKNTFVKAMLDTGNSLIDPFSQLPVIIVELDYIKDFFPQSLYNQLSEPSLSIAKLQSILTENAHISNLRLIPFHALGTENGMILGFRPDCVKFVEEQSQTKDIIVGIYNRNLSKDNEYQALLHPSVI